MKKSLKSKKLSLHKETIADLRRVNGGGPYYQFDQVTGLADWTGCSGCETAGVCM